MQSDYSSLELAPQPALIRLTSKDWQLWRSLRLQALTEAPYAFGSKLAEWQGEGDSETRWRERLESVSLNLIAFLQGNPVGMVSGTEPNENATVELISLWVGPLWRGHGVGDALVEAVIRWATEQRAERLSLGVSEGNEYAGKLYRRHGFIEKEKLVPDTPDDRPEYRFVKTLVE